MIYLLLNILFGSSFILIIKWTQVRERDDTVTVGLINYVVATLSIIPYLLQSEWSEDSPSAMVCGGTMGLCYFIAFFFVTYAIKKIGAASSSVIGALSILLPILCGIWIWDERPNPFQVIGVVLAVAALIMIGAKRERVPNQRIWFTPFVLFIFFLLAGFSRLAQAAFKHESHPDQRPLYLFTAFFCAAVPSVVMLIRRRRIPTIHELYVGVGLGLSNLLQTHFILKSLEVFPGYIVFPVSSAGALVLITLIATQLFKEHITLRIATGIAVAVCAVVLLNWLP